MDSRQHNWFSCPQCGYRMDSSSSVTGKPTVKDGDMGFCIECGRWSRMVVTTFGVSMRKLDPKEQKTIDADPRAQKVRGSWERRHEGKGPERGTMSEPDPREGRGCQFTPLTGTCVAQPVCPPGTKVCQPRGHEPGWDGVSDFYEDDEPMEDVLKVGEREPNVITRRPCAFCLSPNDEDGDCTTECGHTAAEQVRVQRERDELEAVRAPHTYQGEAHKAEPCQYGGPAGCDSSAFCGRQLNHQVHLLADTGFEPQAVQGALGDDGTGEHCSCCAHRRGIGDDPCGGPNCPCGPRRQTHPYELYVPPVHARALGWEPATPGVCWCGRPEDDPVHHLPPLTSAILKREKDRRGTHPLDFINEECGK